MKLKNIFKGPITTCISIALLVMLYAANAAGKTSDTALATGVALITALFVAPDKIKSKDY
jgi:type IV secretory pathway VirB2 component (pilin)